MHVISPDPALPTALPAVKPDEVWLSESNTRREMRPATQIVRLNHSHNDVSSANCSHRETAASCDSLYVPLVSRPSVLEIEGAVRKPVPLMAGPLCLSKPCPVPS